MTTPEARTPRIAVVLPVYNGEKYLAEAIQSVLAQTFGDFELVVVDDGSTDRTTEILAGFSDVRLRLIRHQQNLGAGAALNTGIRESQSEFIARMDADDICHPRRFEKQAAFLEAHPEISVCGTWYRTLGARSLSVRLPVEPHDIRADLFFGAAMCSPTVMLRRSFLEQHALAFNEEFSPAEDYDFLARAAELTRLATIPEFLFLYRHHDRQVTVTQHQYQSGKANRVLVRQLRMLMPSVTKEEEAFHLDLANGLLHASRLAEAENWLLRLDRINLEKGRYDVRYFRRGLREWWHRAHNSQAASAGISVLTSYWNSPFASIRGVGFYSHVALAAKCAIGRPGLSWWWSCRRFFERLRASLHRLE
jgi:glycosyltransferase involved in cell wall biosynthesis